MKRIGISFTLLVLLAALHAPLSVDSAPDTWLADVMQNGFGTQPKLLHGLFTYDISSILRTLRDANGQLTRPSTWQEIDFPLAFVVFAEADAAPWE